MGKTTLVLILLASVLIPTHILSGEDSVKTLEPEVNDVGLSIGQVPPAFILPDLYTGELVSLSDFRGKKTAFFMWASW